MPNQPCHCGEPAPFTYKGQHYCFDDLPVSWFETIGGDSEERDDVYSSHY